MYVRFIVLAPGRRQAFGLFRADISALDDPTLPEWLSQPIEEHRKWFNANLRLPRNRAARKRIPATAICWFRPEAHQHIARARELARLIDEAGHPTAMITTRHVGDVVYSDEFQIVANQTYAHDYQCERTNCLLLISLKISLRIIEIERITLQLH